MKNQIKMICLTAILIGSYAGFLSAETPTEKVWTGAGDGKNWEDEANWAPEGGVGADDVAVVASENANAEISGSIEAKKLLIAGDETAVVTFKGFASGVIQPSSPDADAVLNRRNGLLKMQGPGTVVLKGAYHDSEESTAPQAGFMLLVS